MESKCPIVARIDPSPQNRLKFRKPNEVDRSHDVDDSDLPLPLVDLQSQIPQGAIPNHQLDQ